MKIISKFLHFAILILLLAFPQTARSAVTATFTVNSSGDAADASPGNGLCATAGGVCTLRAAIQEANALAGHDTISIGAYTITPATLLPALSDDAGATIKGNNVTTFIDGNNLVTRGLDIESNNNVIQGLLVWNFTEHGIRVWWGENNLVGTNGDGVNDASERNIILHNGQAGIFLMGGPNRVAGNYIGVFGTGSMASANGIGIYIEGALDAGCGTVIGTNGNGSGDAVEGNLISGNTGSGIYIHNSCARVAGNIIGMNANGTAALPNARGILVDEYAPSVLIGTNGDGVSDSVEGNFISGNTYAGVEISNGVSGVNIAGNTIGLNKAGTAAIANAYGVIISNSEQVTVGTNDNGIEDDREGNLVSGNTTAGIWVEGADSSLNVIAGNLIGTDITGMAAIPNPVGVEFSGGAHHNLIGNDGDGQGDTQERNVISGNGVGIRIIGPATADITVAGNFIGTDEEGSAALANTSIGIHIYGAPDNVIGGQIGNYISGNKLGVLVDQATAVNNTIAFNKIGIKPAADEALPNEVGIQIAAPDNLVGVRGSAGDQEGNTISGNKYYGIYLSGAGTTRNMIAGNYIGVDSQGEAAIPNGSGIFIDSAPGNLIGTNGDNDGDQDEGNLISGNTDFGIKIQGSSANGNMIAGNYIGVNQNGSAGIKNGSGDWGCGIYIDNTPDTLIGTNADGSADAAERNLISGNNTGGLVINGALSTGTIIAGNDIGTGPGGLGAIPNGVGFPDQAVMLQNTMGVRIGTDGDGVNDLAERNVISGNLGYGIRIYSGSGDYLIAGNYIGVDSTGSAALGNSNTGVYIDGAYGVQVGGPAEALRNVIAYNQGDGVTIASGAASTVEVNNIVRGNAIYANSDLGIDLGNDGVTANDSGDADTGPNGLQNFSLLTAAAGNRSSVTLAGFLNSKASTAFWVDLYASLACDSSGNGEGQTYLGSVSIITDASGNASFNITLLTGIQPGAFLTATATGVSNGSTSEFSPCFSAGLKDFRIYLPYTRK